MKAFKSWTFWIILFSVFCAYAFYSLSFPKRVLEDTRDEFVSNITKFQKHIQELKEFARIAKDEANSSPLSPDEVAEFQQLIIKTRLSYKKIEFLAEYYDPETSKRYINGAPLPKIEPNVPKVEIIEPNGLQTLDELIYSDSLEIDQIYELAYQLDRSAQDYLSYLKNVNFEHRHLFEASRFQILRIFTLGVTGFDCPGALNCLEESKMSIEPIIHLFQRYKNFSLDPQAEQTRMKTQTLLEEAYVYLSENTDFNTFDRMHFYKTYVSPLYALIYQLQSYYQIEFVDEVDPTNHAIDYHAKNMFDPQFLNHSFYAKVAKSDLDDPKKIALGKLLFFDPALSRDYDMSCATCHQPSKAFTDGLAKSRSNKQGVSTLRNAPTLINSIYADRYFHDMREYDLERQVKHVVYDEKEFNMDFIELADRLKGSDTYKALFESAYGERDKYGISTWSISNSLAAYVSSLRALNSPFDQYMRDEIQTIDSSIIRGFNLFMGKASCGTCHFPPSFNGTIPPKYAETESEVLGVTVDFDTLEPQLDVDPGRIANGLPREAASHYLFSFKTPTVRNIELTGPYMHNGGFQSLEEVLHFYNQGGAKGMGIDLAHQTLPEDHLELSRNEMDDIIEFMKSLTDTVGLNDVPQALPKFENNPSLDDRLSNVY